MFFSKLVKFFYCISSFITSVEDNGEERIMFDDFFGKNNKKNKKNIDAEEDDAFDEEGG